MTTPLHPSLASWREAPRVRALNSARMRDGPYVLCWLQQTLRSHDNPVIDAAIRLGNALKLPVLVYHGLREDYPFASDRRSEEHTSELQSRQYLVCRLLLEKKKNNR